MKKTGTILALAVAVAVIAAGRLAADPGTSEARSSDGHRSLFSLRNNGLGGYGGPHFKATVLNGRFAVYGGGPIMVILDGCWGLGLSVSTPDGDAAGLDLYYGGARIERIFFPGSLFYWSLGGTAAAGAARYRKPAFPDNPAGLAPILVLEPKTLLSLWILPTLRLAVGGSYRLAFLLNELSGIDAADLHSPCGLVQLQYGIFPKR